MNWAQNKFLIGFGAVMAVGCGALGFLLFQAGSQFSELNADYSKQVTLLNRLQHEPLYPEQSSLDKMEQQKEDAIKAAAAFRAQVTQMCFSLEPVSPEHFQDTLRATVSDVIKKAAAAKVKLPDKFYLGFNEYQGKPPTVEAAPALNRELKAIELAVDLLIDNKVTAISSIQRDPLPEEPDGAKNQAQQASHRQGGSKPVAQISAFPFQIQFVSDQAPFRRVLNAIAGCKKQFLVVRSMLVKNSVDKLIPKTASAPAAASPSATSSAAAALPTFGAPTPSATPGSKPEDLKFLVGTENLNVTLRLDMVVFASAPTN